MKLHHGTEARGLDLSQRRANKNREFVGHSGHSCPQTQAAQAFEE
jgi:hypothetical protein